MAGPNDVSPLHTAIQEGETLEEIRSIVESDPSLLRRRYRGKLPLHDAIVLRPTSPGIVRYLLEQWPESIRERTDAIGIIGGKNLPVHLACDFRNFQGFGRDKMATVRLLVEAWPESLQERNLSGDIPLHLAHPMELIRYLVKMWPQAVREPGAGGSFFLLIAVCRHYPLTTIRFLMKSWPQSIRAKDANGRTALHFINHGSSIESIACLLEQGDDLLLEADNEGYLPLHRLVDAEVDDEDLDQGIVQYLIDRAPQSVRARSNCGSLPLHLAVRGNIGTRLGAIRCLVNAWPESLRERTNSGLLPLHVAAETEMLDYIPYLVQQWPESVQEQARDGSLAVHLVLCKDECFDRDDGEVQRIFDTARFLLDRFPQSVHVATNDGLLPLHVALMSGFYCSVSDDEEENDAELEFIRHLVRRAPSTVRVASNNFLFPFDYAVRSRNVSLRTVQFLVEQWPDVALRLDSDGRTHLHVARTRHKYIPRLGILQFIAGLQTPRLYMLQYIAELRPQLLETRDQNGSLPMHAAVANLPSRDRLLYRSDTFARGFRSSFLPNHLVESLNIVRYFAEQWPQSLAERDNQGSLPLHVALARVVLFTDVVRLLVELRPESVRAADRNGALPLHVALEHSQPSVPSIPPADERNANGILRLAELDANDDDTVRPTVLLELVQFLVENHPDSVRHKDSKGNIPLVIAASHDADLDILFFLATTWPGGICGSCDRAVDQGTPLPSRPLKRFKSDFTNA